MFVGTAVDQSIHTFSLFTLDLLVVAWLLWTMCFTILMIPDILQSTSASSSLMTKPERSEIRIQLIEIRSRNISSLRYLGNLVIHSNCATKHVNMPLSGSADQISEQEADLKALKRSSRWSSRGNELSGLTHARQEKRNKRELTFPRLSLALFASPM